MDTKEDLFDIDRCSPVLVFVLSTWAREVDVSNVQLRGYISEPRATYKNAETDCPRWVDVGVKERRSEFACGRAKGGDQSDFACWASCTYACTHILAVL